MSIKSFFNDVNEKFVAVSEKIGSETLGIATAVAYPASIVGYFAALATRDTAIIGTTLLGGATLSHGLLLTTHMQKEREKARENSPAPKN